VVAVALVALAAYFLVERPWVAKPVAFAPPPHSIAVLPFINMSGDASQQYFSDGMTEELLNSLARINELQVAARTSSFSFQGEHPDIATVAHKLNVAAVLEGSVRRSSHTVRITAQLINGVTGFHLWSQTYDRDLGDVLQLQTEIANAVASVLKVTLLGDVAAKVELGGTRNPAAFDAYLRASKSESDAQDVEGFRAAAAAYTQAIGLDPRYALAFAGRADSLVFAAGLDTLSSSSGREFDAAQADARQAIALAPELAEGHLALARCLDGTLNFAPATEEYERAVALAPGNAPVLRGYSRFGVKMGRVPAGIAAAQRAVVLDPLNFRSHWELAVSLYFARRYDEAIAAFNDTLALNPDYAAVYGLRGFAYYARGDFQGARTSCEVKTDHWASQQCLAVTYPRLGRRADGETQLEKMKASLGDAAAYQYAEVYAQWSNTAKALEWLQSAVRLRDTGLANLKADPLLDPLRKEPRFQAIERELKFPD
jgi:TolB-like protein